MNSLSAYFANHSGVVLLSLTLVLLLSVILTLITAVRVNALSKPLSKVKKHIEPDRVIPAIFQEIEANHSSIQKASSALAMMSDESKSFFKHSALVRYDAFDDVGGKQSYSLCLLDSRKNGYILTYLTGRNSTRSYAVNIENGEASRKLSNEEIQAFEEALSGLKHQASPGY